MHQESDLQHRAFCLWAMQDPLGRSRNAVAQLLGVPEPTTRKWTKRFAWQQRIEDAGEKHDTYATAMYRSLYDKTWGDSDLIVIHAKMRVPYPRIVLTGPPAAPDPIEIRNRSDEARAEKRDARKKIGQLIDAALGTFASALVAKKVRVVMSDLPVLLRLKREYLTELEDDIPDDLAKMSDYELRAIVDDIMRANGLEVEAAQAIKLVAG